MRPVHLALAPDTEAEAVRRVAKVLSEGGVALLPAEGVYGFHALATATPAVDRLRTLKARSAGQAFIGLLARPEEFKAWADPDPVALELARSHWPGALTIVVAGSPETPAALRAPDGTVALRCPGSAFLRSVVTAVGGLVVSTSANRAGLPPAVHADDAPEGWADVIVDGGKLSGLPSTVARAEGGTVRVLREGAVRIAGSAP